MIHIQNSNTWKPQLTSAINFISSEGVDEELIMHWKSNNIDFLSDDNAKEVVNQVLDSFLLRYQIGLETSMWGSHFIFDSAQVFFHKFHKISFKCVGPYIDSPHWIKKEKSNNKSKNTDDKCFQYAAFVALNYEEIESHSERFSNIKPFFKKYHQKGINYPTKIDGWKKFETNNPIISLNILHVKEKEMCPAYISKTNSNCEHQIILLMIPGKEKEGWYHLAGKKCLHY